MMKEQQVMKEQINEEINERAANNVRCNQA